MRHKAQWRHPAASKALDLHRNLLTKLPEGVGMLTALQSLDLRRNQLTEIPAGIGGLPDLYELQLSHNQLVQSLRRAYQSGLPALRSYLLNLERPDSA